MKSSEIAPREPALAAVAHDKFVAPGVRLVGTTPAGRIRVDQRVGAARDGGPAVAVDDVGVVEGILEPAPTAYERLYAVSAGSVRI